MMIIDTEFNIGDNVYLKTDSEQKKRIVTGYCVRKTSMSYLLSCSTEESTHYDFEITKEIDILMTTTN